MRVALPETNPQGGLVLTKHTHTMLTSINKKHQAKVNKAINWLIKYDAANTLRNQTDGDGDEKAYKKANRICGLTFDKYLDIVSELPKGEVKRIESSKYY